MRERISLNEFLQEFSIACYHVPVFQVFFIKQAFQLWDTTIVSSIVQIREESWAEYAVGAVNHLGSLLNYDLMIVVYAEGHLVTFLKPCSFE